MNPYKYTILTAYYRGDTYLPRLTKRLNAIAQNRSDFHWILIDDFSHDGGKSRAALTAVEEEVQFPAEIHYLPENYWGSESVKLGAQLAQGEYIILLDQDDLLTIDALQIFDNAIARVQHRQDFAGVHARCKDETGTLVGTPFSESYFYGSIPEYRHKKRVRGELHVCTRTTLFREYVKEIQKGYPFGFIWSGISDAGYNFLFTNEVTRIYDRSNENAVSRSPVLDHVRNDFRFRALDLDDHFFPLLYDPVTLLKRLILCARYQTHARELGGAALEGLSLRTRFLLRIASPFGRLYAHRDKKKFTIRG